ncbi:MAG TPA: ABC transporter permease [Steroidobacteraceae bacterium]|jgi:putative ABC transport system permease protein
MGVASQIVSATGTNLLNVPRRPGNSLAIVISIAGVVAVLICVLAMYAGFRKTLQADGKPDRAIVMARSAEAEASSNVTRETVATISNAPGIRHDAAGKPIVSAELLIPVPVARKRDRSDVSITLRGVGPQYFVMRPELKIIEGRTYRPGTRELVVGAAASKQFAGLNVGDKVRLQSGDWDVVGVYGGGDGARQSEMVTDSLTLMSAFKVDGFNDVMISLDSPASLARVKSYLAADATIQVDAQSEPAYLEGAGGDVNTLLRVVTISIGSIMALGALFGALNSMHSAVAARTVELATLRAIGFAPFAVATSILGEALLLALLGAVIGATLAYTAFNGTVISTLGGSIWDSQLVYALTITPALVAVAISVACVLGLLGGMFPAIRAARANVAEALRET